MALWNVCRCGRKATPNNARDIFCYSNFKAERSIFFPEVQNFMLHQQNCIINARRGTKKSALLQPQGKKKERIRHDHSTMKILRCDLWNQGKNMVTIP